MAGVGVQQAKALPWNGRQIGLHKLDSPGGVRLLVAVPHCGTSNAAGHAGPALNHFEICREHFHRTRPTRQDHSILSTTSFSA